MKYLLILLLSPVLTVHSQNVILEKVIPIYESDPEFPGVKSYWLPMNFDQSQFIEKMPEISSSSTIERVDLIYSEYQESKSFDQKQLNQRRIKQLISQWPVTKDPLIDWRIIGQSQASDNASARKLFHGFVIYYRPESSVESTLSEISYMDAFVSKAAYHDLASLSSTTDMVKTVATASVPKMDKRKKMQIANKMRRKFVTPPEDEDPKLRHMRDHYFQNECYISHSGIKRGTSKELQLFIDKINVSGQGRTGLKYHFSSSNGHDINTLHYVFYDLKEECDTSDRSSASSFEQFNDYNKFNVVQEVFDRNPKWNKSLVVMDVTGSMARYSAQTMSWLKVTQNKQKIAAFVFFNDGDSTENENKTSGSVGGIYGMQNASFDQVYDEIKKSMLNGNGGDRSENNYEAVNEGHQLYPNCNYTVLIADNRATPRDYNLVKKMKSPLHIILCGANNQLNLSYVQAAFDTKGSIHTLNADYDLSEIKQGESFSLGKNRYKWQGSKIVQSR